MKAKWNNWMKSLKSKWKKKDGNKASDDTKIEVKKMNSKKEFNFPGANSYERTVQSMHLDQVKNFYARYEARSYQNGQTFYVKREMISFQ